MRLLVCYDLVVIFLFCLKQKWYLWVMWQWDEGIIRNKTQGLVESTKYKTFFNFQTSKNLKTYNVNTIDMKNLTPWNPMKWGYFF